MMSPPLPGYLNNNTATNTPSHSTTTFNENHEPPTDIESNLLPTTPLSSHNMVPRPSFHPYVGDLKEYRASSKRKIGEVWSHFGLTGNEEIDCNFVYCRHYNPTVAPKCQGWVKKQQNSKYPRDHLKTCHPNIFLEQEEQREDVKRFQPADDIKKYVPPSPNVANYSTPVAVPPMISFDSTSAASSVRLNNDLPEKLSADIVSLFVDCDYSFESVNHETWRLLFLRLGSETITKQHLTATALNQYNVGRMYLVQQMQSIDSVAFTTEAGCIQNNPFVALVAHWFDANWELQHAAIALQCQGRNSSVDLRTNLILEDLIQHWKIQPHSTSTDIAANLLQDFGPFNHDDILDDELRCPMFALQLAVLATLSVSPLKELIFKATLLVMILRDHAEQSSVLTEAFAQYDIFNDIIEEKTIAAKLVARRWHSTLHLLEVVSKNRNEIELFLRSNPISKDDLSSKLNELKEEDVLTYDGVESISVETPESNEQIATEKSKVDLEMDYEEDVDPLSPGIPSPPESSEPSAKRRSCSGKKRRSKNNLRFSEEDWLHVEELVLLLKPFEKLGQVFEGEKFSTTVTISSIIPIIHRLQRHCQGYQIFPSSAKVSTLSDEIRRLAEQISKAIEIRFKSIWTNNLFQVAVMLDPSYRSIYNWYIPLSDDFNHREANVLKELFVRTLSDAFGKETLRLKLNENSRRLGSHVNHSFNDFLGIVPVAPTSDNELTRYVQSLGWEATNANVYWRHNAVLFPTIGNIAKRVLAIPVSVASSGSLYSLSKQGHTPLNVRLNLDLLRPLVFLKSNNKLVEKLKKVQSCAPKHSS